MPRSGKNTEFVYAIKTSQFIFQILCISLVISFYTIAKTLGHHFAVKDVLFVII